YDPYGHFDVLTPARESRGASDFGWVYLHQGGRWDGEAALYSFRMRDYSPILMRWIGQDPLRYNAGDSNLYRAFADSVVVFRDPLGLEVTDMLRAGGQPRAEDRSQFSRDEMRGKCWTFSRPYKLLLPHCAVACVTQSGDLITYSFDGMWNTS